MQPIVKNATIEEDTSMLIPCPQCDGNLVERNGRYGTFYGCTNFRSGCRQTLQESQIQSYLRSLKTEGAKSDFKPTVEQQEIFDWVLGVKSSGSGSLLVEACAGSGKTTTIAQAIKLIKGSGESNLVYLVFNAKNREEAQLKGLPAQTTHQHGFAAIRSYMSSNNLGKVEVNQYKTADTCKAIIGNSEACLADMKWMIGPTAKIIGLIKNNFLELTLDNVNEFIIAYDIDLPPHASSSKFFCFVREVWARVVNTFSQIDFDDMLFLPIYHNMKIKKYKWVFADEVQDFNACQLELLKRTVGQVLFAVGDRNQSCYAFRGAALEAMDDIKTAFTAEELTLSVSFRANQNVTRYINREFPHIKFSCLPAAKEGVIETIYDDKLTSILENDDLVLCRVNAPLVSYVFELLRVGRKATIIGRDLASQLTSMVERFAGADGGPIVPFLEKLNQYRFFEVKKLNDLGREMAAETLNDKVDTIIAISDNCQITGEVIQRIERIFSQDQGEGVSFSSVHRAKGLEANRVFILRPELMPHPAAEGKPTQEQQEVNIRYIASTRSKDEMYFVKRSE